MIRLGDCFDLLDPTNAQPGQSQVAPTSRARQQAVHTMYKNGGIRRPHDRSLTVAARKHQLLAIALNAQQLIDTKKSLEEDRRQDATKLQREEVSRLRGVRGVLSGSSRSRSTDRHHACGLCSDAIQQTAVAKILALSGNARTIVCTQRDQHFRDVAGSAGRAIACRLIRRHWIRPTRVFRHVRRRCAGLPDKAGSSGLPCCDGRISSISKVGLVRSTSPPRRHDK